MVKLVVSSLVVVVLASTACASHPTSDEALRDFFGAFCADLSKCDPNGFAMNWPQGQQQCVDQNVGSIHHDSSAEESCTTDQTSKCTTDIRALSCDEFANVEIGVLAGKGVSAFPSSCSGC